MRDVIFVEALSLEAKIGCSAAERSQTQRIELDIKICADCGQSAKTLSLSDTVCYDKVVEDVRELVRSREWVLVEELAEAACSLILSSQPKAQEVCVQVRKFCLPDIKSVGVEITRGRSAPKA